MNAHPMNPSSSPSSSPKDLFFRLADRLQIDACLEAIEQDGKSVILHSLSPGLLDHYSQILVQRLRKRLPETPTEIFFPTHTEALIARFNDLLEHVSVDDATQSPGPQPPQKLWIVHDASALPEHELKLLLRLLQHLPGARVSAVLVLSGQAASLRNLDPQGRRLMRWEIEPPTQAQMDQMVDEARQAGREFAALELIARLQPPPPPPTREASLPKPAAAALGALGAATPGPAPADAAPPVPARPRTGNRTLAVVIGALLLLLLSAGVASWLHPEVLQGLWHQATQTRAASGPAATASSPASAPASAEAPAAAPVQASPASEPASAPAVTASEAAPAASVPPAAASAPAALSTAPAPATAAPPAAAAAAPASTPKVVSELPDSAQNGLAWLRKLEADTWVIEHGRHPTAQAARKQIAADKLLANARIGPVVQPGADTAQFLVVTGPFRSMDRARNYMARNELGRSAVVHDVNTLKSLTPSGPTTQRRP